MNPGSLVRVTPLITALCSHVRCACSVRGCGLRSSHVFLSFTLTAYLGDRHAGCPCSTGEGPEAQRGTATRWQRAEFDCLFPRLLVVTSRGLLGLVLSRLLLPAMASARWLSGSCGSFQMQGLLWPSESPPLTLHPSVCLTDPMGFGARLPLPPPDWELPEGRAKSG